MPLVLPESAVLAFSVASDVVADFSVVLSVVDGAPVPAVAGVLSVVDGAVSVVLVVGVPVLAVPVVGEPVSVAAAVGRSGFGVEVAGAVAGAATAAEAVVVWGVLAAVGSPPASVVLAASAGAGSLVAVLVSLVVGVLAGVLGLAKVGLGTMELASTLGPSQLRIRLSGVSGMVGPVTRGPTIPLLASIFRTSVIGLVAAWGASGAVVMLTLPEVRYWRTA